MKKKLIILLSIIAIIITACLCLVGCNAKPKNDNLQQETSSDGSTFVFQEIIAKTKMSAVCIFAGNTPNSRSSSGSGFIISTDGYVVTNKHVVNSYKYFTVLVIDEDNKVTTYEAKLIVASSNPDIAVLKINSIKSFNPIKFAKSATVDFGDPCVMIGNPKGVGFMSARAMVANPKVNINNNKYVAIDAPVNPGNSGGALINANCEVVGVITSRHTSVGSVNDVVMDMGFAQHTEDVVDYLLKTPAIAEVLDYWS